MGTRIDGLEGGRRAFLQAIGAGVLANAALVPLAWAAETKTLRAAITGYTVIGTLDPAVVKSISESMTLWAIFNALVKFDEKMTIVPDLAESWAVDGNAWTFKLKKGVKFHDGSEMTADDVKFSLERLRDPKTESPYKSKLDAVASIDIVDPYTVKITTKEPFAPLLTFLTNTRTGTQIVPRKAVEAMGAKEFGQKPVGTGPFKFVEYIPGQKIVLEAHKEYFVKSEPKVDRAEIALVAQETSAVNAILAGNMDLSSSAPFADVPALKKNAKIKVSSMVGLNYRYMELNNKQAPFDDVHFRRAVSMAFDRQSLVEVVLFGEGAPANGLIPPGIPAAYDTTPRKTNTFDPDAAKAELKKSKHPASMPVTVVTFGSSWWKRWAEVFVDQVNNTLGTQLKVEVTDDNGARTRIYANNIQAAVWGYLGFIDPDEYMYEICHTKGSRNNRGYSNPELDKLLEGARREMDVAKRGALYKKAEAIVADDVPVISCFSNNAHNLWAPRVSGFVPLPYSAFGSQFGGVSLSS